MRFRQLDLGRQVSFAAFATLALVACSEAPAEDGPNNSAGAAGTFGGAGGTAGTPAGGASGMVGVGGQAGVGVVNAGTTGGMVGVGGQAGVGTAGGGGMYAGAGGGAAGTGGDVNLCDASAAFEPLVAVPGEKCYDFLTHNGGFEGDPFIVPVDESYNQLYYDIPWGDDEVATRFGADFDNQTVLHHWLGFETNEGRPHGTVAKNVTGSTGGDLGGGFDTKLFGGWAVGGCNVDFPADTGLELPKKGQKQSCSSGITTTSRAWRSPTRVRSRSAPCRRPCAPTSPA